MITSILCVNLLLIIMEFFCVVCFVADSISKTLIRSEWFAFGLRDHIAQPLTFVV